MQESPNESVARKLVGGVCRVEVVASCSHSKSGSTQVRLLSVQHTSSKFLIQLSRRRLMIV